MTSAAIQLCKAGSPAIWVAAVREIFGAARSHTAPHDSVADDCRPASKRASAILIVSIRRAVSFCVEDFR